jgi:NAD+ synthase (glutamine-hydrolysing)
MLIACAQINTIVGGFLENKNKIINTIHDAISKKIDILVFPECTICGYPPEDLLLKDQFIDDNIKILSEIADEVYNLTDVIGFIDKKNNNIFNALLYYKTTK